MKYGESTFDILYLLFVIISGCMILKRAQDRTDRFMGIAALVLGCGDAFHLVPRVLNYFSDADMTIPLGVGKLITSVTMTVFYLLQYYIWLGRYKEKNNRNLTVTIWCLAAIRILLCLFPQNGWLQNSSDLSWGIIRNIPFVILGAVILCLFYRNRKADGIFKRVWLYILLSFAFYIPVAVGAGLIPILGMLMLPKTVCYILVVVVFLRGCGIGPFFRERQQPKGSYDHENKKPVIRASICTGEKVAGFRNMQTGVFEEVMLIRNSDDLAAFKERYGIEGDIEKIY